MWGRWSLGSLGPLGGQGDALMRGPQEDIEQDIEQRVAAHDWTAVADALSAEGCSVVPGLLRPAECEALRGMYGEAERFRKQVVMEKHGFGRGHYQYFAAPLPPLVAALREACYRPLSLVANRFQTALGEPAHFPMALQDYLKRCTLAGQPLPTPLLLRYGAGDYNCLHQDLYGEEVFPLQVAVLLSRPIAEFEGGEFVMTEQRPRMQSRPLVVSWQQGDAVVFATRVRPVQGQRGIYRVAMRHGVSRVRSGERYTLGLIFHNAAT